jgi:glutamyl-tRNA synthetase
MQKKFKPGQVTVRMKIDMQHLNTTLRDPSIMKISSAPHARTGKKFKVWPLYDFGTAMMDVWEKVTHRVRTKEFELRGELQDRIRSSLGYRSPVIIEMGRFQIRGAVTKGREIREMIAGKKLLGWDDPRLTTLIALRRRGFVPEAIKDFLLSTGLTKAESEIEWEALEAYNRKAVDAVANRYFAIMQPVWIIIGGMPKMKGVKLLLHPDFPKRGSKKIPIDRKEIFVEKNDYENLKGRTVGLIGLGTIKLSKESQFGEKQIPHELQKIQWVSKPNVRIDIVMPDGSTKKGIGEVNMKKLKVDQMIQLVRVGFCRVDKVNKDIVLYYAHK